MHAVMHFLSKKKCMFTEKKRGDEEYVFEERKAFQAGMSEVESMSRKMLCCRFKAQLRHRCKLTSAI
jgi:hypothetical protein